MDEAQTPTKMVDWSLNHELSKLRVCDVAQGIWELSEEVPWFLCAVSDNEFHFSTQISSHAPSTLLLSSTEDLYNLEISWCRDSNWYEKYPYQFTVQMIHWTNICRIFWHCHTQTKQNWVLFLVYASWLPIATAQCGLDVEDGHHARNRLCTDLFDSDSRKGKLRTERQLQPSVAPSIFYSDFHFWCDKNP